MTTDEKKNWGYSYAAYTPSQSVTDAQNTLASVNAAKPADYSSQYASQLKDAQNAILNRKGFSYDVNNDALYQQMKENYINQGKLAMKDTMGQAAGLTGGYGNSYAQAVGQQQYNSYLQQLNDNIPELYNMALNAYNTEGDRLNANYNLLNSAENQDYSRYQDAYSNWYNERANAQTNYNTERDYDRSLYESDRSWDYSLYNDEMANAQTMVNYYISKGIMPSDDLIAASGYSRDYIQSLVNDALAAMAYVPEEEVYSGGGGGGKKKNEDDKSTSGNLFNAISAGINAATPSSGASQSNLFNAINTGINSAGSGNSSGNSSWISNASNAVSNAVSNANSAASTLSSTLSNIVKKYGK